MAHLIAVRFCLAACVVLSVQLATAQEELSRDLPWIDPAGIRDSLLLCSGEATPEVKQRFAALAGVKARIVIISSGEENLESDLLPGILISHNADADELRAQLFTALVKQPGAVGIGLAEGAALLVRGRQIEAVGKSSITIFLAGSDSRPRREIILNNGDKHDLVALRRAALARTLPAFPAKEPSPSQVPNGSLVIVGGGAMPKEITEKFIELAGGADSPLVVLPTANPPAPNDNKPEGAFLSRAGAKHVRTLPQRTRAEVESPEFAAALAEAKGVWFGGGRQWRFVDAYAQTKAEEQFRDVLKRGGVIGGSSAGASIQAEYLVRGSPLGNAEMMSEGYERGLGFLPGTAIDQHFAQRKRFTDMTGVMKTFPQILGIGIDESAALVVQGRIARVLGRGNVQFYDYRAGTPAGERDYIVAKPGERYDLLERKLLP